MEPLEKKEKEVILKIRKSEVLLTSKQLQEEIIQLNNQMIEQIKINSDEVNNYNGIEKLEEILTKLKNKT